VKVLFRYQYTTLVKSPHCSPPVSFVHILQHCNVIHCCPSCTYKSHSPWKYFYWFVCIKLGCLCCWSSILRITV